MAVHQMQQDQQNSPPSSSATDSNAATFSSVYRHLKSSYHWADMRDDVRRWHEDWERMRLSNARVLGVLAAASGAIGPTTPNRVTFKAGDDLNATLDTCLDMTMDNTPPSSVPSTPITNNMNPVANHKKTATPMKDLRRAMKSLSPKRAAASSSGLATVGYSQRGSSKAPLPPFDGSVVSASPQIPRAPRRTSNTSSMPSRASAATPPPLPDAPAIVRRTSFSTLLRGTSRDGDDDAATVISYTSSPAGRRGTQQSTPTSSQRMKKSESVESFGKRVKGKALVKGIGKKIGAAGRKTVGSKKSRSSSPSPSCVSADAKSRVSLAWNQQQQKEEKSGAAPLADNMQLASNQFCTFLDTLADSLCNDGNSGDEAEVWQRAVPTVIGNNIPKKHK